MRKQWILGCLVSLCVAGITQGSVVGGAATSAGDDFALILSPTNVGNNNHQDDNTLYAFNERQGVLLGSALAVDSLNGGGSGSIAPGIRISSHYVFFDPAGTQTILGNVRFDGVVIGIITTTTNLNASDFLGASGTNYLSPSLRGLESGDTTIRNGTLLNQVDVNLTASSPGDYVRVITAAAVPLPAAAWSGAALLAGLVIRSIRRR